MANIQTKITINRALGIVSEYAANPDNTPKWSEHINHALRQSPQPLSVGSQIVFNGKFWGREMDYTYEVIEYFPGLKLVMRSTDGQYPMEMTYSWIAKSPRETQMILQNTGGPSGFSKVFSPLMANRMKKANKKDLKRLKRVLEGAS